MKTKPLLILVLILGLIYPAYASSRTLHLEKVFTLDLEKDLFAEKGLADIDSFVVDSNGNIYCLYRESQENCIFKFDRDGHFIGSFGRRGRGPGEVNMTLVLTINHRDEILFQNFYESKIVVLSSEGDLIKEIAVPSGLTFLKQMENDCFFMIRSNFIDPTHVWRIWGLYTPELEKIKDLETQKLEGNSYLYQFQFYKDYAASDTIYIGKRTPSYEICVYNAEGELQKRIKKDYKPVKISDEYKEAQEKKWEDMQKRGVPPPPVKRTYPKNWSAFQDLFASDDGWIFVMTYEKSEQPRHYVYDVFNPEGNFIGRTSLDNYKGIDSALPIKARNNRLYSLRQKENGYKELVVYKMKWE